MVLILEWEKHGAPQPDEMVTLKDSIFPIITARNLLKHGNKT